MHLFHGTNAPADVVKAVVAARAGSRALAGDFHTAEKEWVSRNYGKYVFEFTMASMVDGARVGTINKPGNVNKAVGEQREVVMLTDASKLDFASKIAAMRVILADGQSREVDLDTGALV